ncbi:hypothetical protein AVEN_145582-1 [Araneus ventricosus]|uniref:Uncharacterized protein n=1 Tax=Araneus ventricosus TaxID=182803 RepID=A0A4Y1ZLC7_ARAVE|nr:hypothetical protein AVEN_38947-1 [Araneus ventricosus]GBL56233.1 hypothetical protein AVEN_145582-1 [Araneus ventricosus]
MRGAAETTNQHARNFSIAPIPVKSSQSGERRLFQRSKIVEFVCSAQQFHHSCVSKPSQLNPHHLDRVLPSRECRNTVEWPPVREGLRLVEGVEEACGALYRDVRRGGRSEEGMAWQSMSLLIV